jgi:hypothetical protein
VNIDDPQQEETVAQAFADYLNLVDEEVAKISDTDIRARISRAMNHGAQRSAAVSASHGDPVQRSLLRTGREIVGSRTGTVLVAGTGVPHRVGVHLAQSREVSRTADSVVGASGSLTALGGDLRMMSDGDREETRAVVAEWRERLSACPAEAFGAEGSAPVLGTVATLAETLIADRDERAALDLIRTAFPHLVFVGRYHPAGFEVRRVAAEALSELGWYQRAETVLRGLGGDEQRVLGSADPRTALLLLWTLVGQNRLQEAESGFRSLEQRLTWSPGTDTAMLLHAQCRRSWLLGRLGLVDDAVSDYTRVIIRRTNELGEDHADTLDAQHSLLKVQARAGQGALALPFLQALADDRARVQGDRHPDTLETRKYFLLARVQAEPGNDRIVARAIHELVEIERIQRERHGQGHPLRHDTTAWLRKLLRDEPVSDLRHTPIADEEQRQTIPWPLSSSGFPINSRTNSEVGQ